MEFIGDRGEEGEERGGVKVKSRTAILTCFLRRMDVRASFLPCYLDVGIEGVPPGRSGRQRPRREAHRHGDGERDLHGERMRVLVGCLLCACGGVGRTWAGGCYLCGCVGGLQVKGAKTGAATPSGPSVSTSAPVSTRGHRPGTGHGRQGSWGPCDVMMVCVRVAWDGLDGGSVRAVVPVPETAHLGAGRGGGASRRRLWARAAASPPVSTRCRRPGAE